MKRQEFFHLWRELSNFEELYQLVLVRCGIDNPSDLTTRTLRNNVSKTSSQISERWDKSGRRMNTFLQKFEDWLKGEDFLLFKGQLFHLNLKMPYTSRGSAGRPMKPFQDSSMKTKRRRVRDLVRDHSASKLTFAAGVALRAAGERSAANLVSEIATSHSDVVRELKNLREQQSKQRCMTPTEALALYVDTKSTSLSYKLNRKKALSMGHLLYPSYYALMKAKRACIPPENTILVTETEKRLRSEIENKSQEEQTQDHIYTIRTLIEKRSEKNKELYIACLDLKAAFDKVPRKYVWKALEELGVTPKLKRNIKRINTNSTGIVN
ncbi:hypothetical protein ILUMI_18533 [Ignelater luminosus]|uniref:Reverse transcriptase domain-containing protein n=1 Tax=Ignelater luminosus TaxID=2038154 RepID=A0A8K0G0T1_IGNLU|nr:hypothetical protein ILUMI_18533 [Ignelater luminosus]